MKTKDIILAAVAFQIVWFACVLFGSMVALGATAALWYYYTRLMSFQPIHYGFIATIVVIGVLVDSVLMRTGIIVFAHSALLPPLWLICLWFNFAMLVLLALPKIVVQKYLFAGLSLLGGGLSYIAGIALSEASLGVSTGVAYPLFFILWLLIGFGIHLIYKRTISG